MSIAALALGADDHGQLGLAAPVAKYGRRLAHRPGSLLFACQRTPRRGSAFRSPGDSPTVSRCAVAERDVTRGPRACRGRAARCSRGRGVVAPWLLSRVISIVVLLAAVNDPARGSRFEQVATRWDGAYYLDIARNGYGPVDIPFPKWPFFPLLPGLIRALERDRPTTRPPSSWSTSSLFLVALAGVYRLASRHGRPRVAAPRGVVARAVPGVVRVLDDVPVGDLPRRVGVGVRVRRGAPRPRGRPGRGRGGAGPAQRARAGDRAGDRGARRGDGRCSVAGPSVVAVVGVVRVLLRPHRRRLRVPHHQGAVAGDHVRRACSRATRSGRCCPHVVLALARWWCWWSSAAASRSRGWCSGRCTSCRRSSSAWSGWVATPTSASRRSSPPGRSSSAGRRRRSTRCCGVDRRPRALRVRCRSLRARPLRGGVGSGAGAVVEGSLRRCAQRADVRGHQLLAPAGAPRARPRATPRTGRPRRRPRTVAPGRGRCRGAFAACTCESASVAHTVHTS